jgi:hypothetical protein
LEFDRLERLQLLSSGTGVHHSLGAVIAPSVVQPRVQVPAQIVDPHVSINNYMAGLLGSEIQPIQQVVETQNTSQHSKLVDSVLGNAFVHLTLGDQDTYTLLNSSGMSSLIGFSQVTDTATYVVPASSILLPGTVTSQVLIPSSGGLPGFIVSVPTTNIRPLSDGQVAVLVPLNLIPTIAPPPTSVSALTGSLADVFASSGALIVSALNTGLPLHAPNAPATVPGLRLARLLAHERSYPLGSVHYLLHLFRIAINRGLFSLGSDQLSQVQAALQQFYTTANVLNSQGTFTPAIPPAAPPLPGAHLGGTLEVSIGALQNLVNVAPGLTGLQIPNVGNFPGRIDVGYIFARNGDYGLVLTLRGPLYGVPPESPLDTVGSTLQVEVSNAQNLVALDGQRTVEGLSIGTALMGTVSTSRTASGVSTFATSAGYGTGLEYGTGIAYTQVIPLGNVNALIPQAPPVR